MKHFADTNKKYYYLWHIVIFVCENFKEVWNKSWKMADCKDNDNDDRNFCQSEVPFVCLVFHVLGMVNRATNAPPQIFASLLKIKSKFSLA